MSINKLNNKMNRLKMYPTFYTIARTVKNLPCNGLHKRCHDYHAADLAADLVWALDNSRIKFEKPSDRDALHGLIAVALNNVFGEDQPTEPVTMH